MTDSYLRYPHIWGDDIVFVADDDLWLVPTAGGRASRLTSERSPVRHPRFSPDGSRIAQWEQKPHRLPAWVRPWPAIYMTWGLILPRN